MAIAELLTLLIFTFILAKSSSVVVESAAKLAKFFGVSQLAIGLLLIAVSTSLPELAVSVMSSVAGEGAIAAGNVFGSNIADILLVLGLGAFLYGFKVNKKEFRDIGLALLLTTIISLYIVMHSEVFGFALGVYEGILLLMVAVWYASHVLKQKKIDDAKEGGAVGKHEAFVAFLFFGAGITAVILSSTFVVDSAISLAAILGLSKSFIGATIIAIGTSLPELSIDLAAIRKKEYGLALGDAIGSTIMNITLVLGTAAVISPIFVQLPVFIAALLFAVLASSVFIYIAAVRKSFGRRDGIAMLALYVLYLLLIFSLQFGEAGIGLSKA